MDGMTTNHIVSIDHGSNGGFPIATFDYRRVIWNNHVMPKPLSQDVFTVFTIFSMRICDTD